MLGSVLDVPPGEGSPYSDPPAGFACGTPVTRVSLGIMLHIPVHRRFRMVPGLVDRPHQIGATSDYTIVQGNVTAPTEIPFSGVVLAGNNSARYPHHEPLILDQWLNVKRWVCHLEIFANSTFLDPYLPDGHFVDITADFTIATGALATVATDGSVTFDTTDPVAREDLYTGVANDTRVGFTANGSIADGDGPSPYNYGFDWEVTLSLTIPHGRWGHHNGQKRWMLGFVCAADLTLANNPGVGRDPQYIEHVVPYPNGAGAGDQCEINLGYPFVWSSSGDPVLPPLGPGDVQVDQSWIEHTDGNVSYWCINNEYTANGGVTLSVDPDGNGTLSDLGNSTFMSREVKWREEVTDGRYTDGSGLTPSLQVRVTLEPDGYYGTW